LHNENKLIECPPIAGFKLKLIEMNSSGIIGSWNERKSKLRKKFGFLTDNDLLFEEGKKEEMLLRLQKKLGKTKEELLKIIATL